MAIKGIRANTLGFNNPSSETEVTVDSALIISQTYTIVAPNGGGSGTDTVDNILLSETSPYNVIVILIANSGSTITLTHNAGSTGNIYTLTGLDADITSTSPTFFYYDQTSGNFYQISQNKSGSAIVLDDISDVNLTPPYVQSTLLAYNTSSEEWTNSDTDANSIKYSASTSIRSGAIIEVNGGDNTKYDIGASTVQFVDNYTDPEVPTMLIASVVAQIARTPTYLATNGITYLGYKLDNTVPGGYTATGLSATVNGSASTIYLIEKSDVQFTQEELREIVEIGILVHRDNLTVQRVVNESTYLGSEGLILYDLISSIGVFNISGNTYAPNGANLKLDKSSGQTHRIGVNLDGTANGRKRPNIIDDNPLTQVPFIYRYQDGLGGFVESSISTITDIDPDSYDDGSGVLQTVSNNKWTIQTIYWYTTGNTRIQYGQFQYDTKEEAKSAIATRAYVEDSNLISNASLRGWLIVQKGATNLSDTTQAEFVVAGKFGFGGGGGGGDTLGALTATLGSTVRGDGTVWETIANNVTATTSPLSSNDETQGYAVGSYWIDTTNDIIYQAVDVTTENAIWAQVSANTNIRTITSSDTVTTNDRYIIVDASASAITVTFPLANTTTGLTFDVYVINADGGNVTITSTASELIDGETEQILTARYESVTVLSTGNEYIII